jgi:hypothetical protein
VCTLSRSTHLAEPGTFVSATASIASALVRRATVRLPIFKPMQIKRLRCDALQPSFGRR